MAGDRVQVVKDGDRRLGQSGTVVHIATQGAKVRFSDGQEEGFKRSSLHAPARLSFSARARTLQKLLPARAPQTAAQPLPPQRSQSAGAPTAPPSVRRTQSAPAQTSWEEELVQLDARVQRLASSSRTPQLVQAARQHSNPKGTTRNASALARARAAAARQHPNARQGGPPRPVGPRPATARLATRRLVELAQIQVDTEEEEEEGAPQRSLSPHRPAAPSLREQLARLRAAGALTEADPPTMAQPDAAPRHPSPQAVGATTPNIRWLEPPRAVGSTTPAYARRQAARTRWRQLRAAQRIVAWYHGRLEAPERCAVCLEALYEAHVERDAVRCGDGHLVCRCCLPRIVTASAARAPLNLSAEEQWSGRYLVRCPLHGHGCSAAALPLTRLAAVLARAPDGEGEAAFEALLEAQLRLTAEHARLAPPVVVDGAPLTPGQPQTAAAAAAAAARPPRWVRGLADAGGRVLAQVTAQPAEAIERRREAKAQRRALAEAAEALRRASAEVQRAESLQALQAALREGDGSYLAYECPRCGCGPITHVNCTDLRAHHRDRARSGRGRISNACPHCGWFSANISDWPRWTGERVGPRPQSMRTAARRALKKKMWGR